VQPLYFDEAHPWVAKLLDQGKPQRVIELGRNPRWHEDLPRVLRPDLVLTETGREHFRTRFAARRHRFDGVAE
jgi:hypothetical protein